MRRYILAIFVLLLAFPFSVFTQTNPTNLLKALLDLPAPPPFEKNAEGNPVEFSNANKLIVEKGYDITNVPSDDAPIEVLLLFWGRYAYSQPSPSLRAKLTDVVADRIFDEIENKPILLTGYINILPPKKDYIEFAKQFYDEKSLEVKNQTEIDYEDIVKPRKTVGEAIAAAEEMARKANQEKESNSINQYTLQQVKTWLTNNSKYFSDELLAKANKLKERRNYVANKESLITLAKVDWEKAEPLVEPMFGDKSKPAMLTIATWAYYVHFLKEDDERSASKYRRILQDIAEDTKAADGVRDMALDALLTEKDFDGRDDWYISLLEDETLFKLGNYTGLKTFMEISDPNVWIPKMLELVGHSNPAVHRSAVRNLTILLNNADKKNDELILRALLPWLSDPNWADPSEGRTDFISSFGRIMIPESVPGLISVVQNEKVAPVNVSDAMKDGDEKDAMDKASDKMKDAKSSSQYKRLSQVQSAAIKALSKYKDSRAVPVLQAALADTSLSYQRSIIISAIIKSNGYDVNQQFNSIEALARKIVADGDVKSIDEVYYGSTDETYKLDEEIGLTLINEENIDEDVIRLVIERIKVLRKPEPQVAGFLAQILGKWNSKAIDIERLNSINNNTADVATIVKALADRKELLKKYPNQVFAMRGNGGISSGIAACMLENQSELLSVINSGDINTRVAGFACARLLRMSLPIDVIGNLLNSPNELLALAAERYLTAEDSIKARNLVLAKHPNQAKILGSRNAFIPNPKNDYSNLQISELFTSINPDKYFFTIDLTSIDKTQDKLRKEIKENKELLGIYAFLENEETGHKILRIYKDKAVYSWYEDDARFREVILKNEDLNLIYQYVTDKQIDGLEPIISGCSHGCPSKEFVMFGRNGGRRIFIYAGYFYEQPLFGLEMIFTSLEQGESKLRYHLQDKIAGLEIILNEKDIKAKSLWKNGEDFRVLILDEKRETEIEKELQEQSENARKGLIYSNFDEDQWTEYYRRSQEISKEIEKQRIERKNEPYSWRSVNGNKLGERVSQPAEDYTIDEDGKFPEIDDLDSPKSVWKARNSRFEVRTGDYQTDGIWKVSPNGLTNQVSKDTYTNDIVTSEDGKWAVLARGSGGYDITDIYRYNLQTGKEYKIDLPDALSSKPIAYIKSQNKFLVYRGNLDHLKENAPYAVKEAIKKFGKEKMDKSTPTYYLLDAETGSFKPVKGEFRPFEQITSRNLQRTSKPDIYWVAIPDSKKKQTQIGRYNAKTFSFKEVMKIPEIQLTSMNIWVDEKEAKIYFIYEGHLLSLPLKPSE